jgi:hypothetical protein
MIILFEKFIEKKYIDAKNKRDQRGIQKLGDKFIVDIVENGDFDGLNYLLKTGYNIQESGQDENLITVAVKSNQLEMLDYLLNNKYAFDYENGIDSIVLSDLVGQNHIGDKKKITSEAVEWLKIITKYGYSFYDGNNLIELYLTEVNGYKGKDKDGKYIYKEEFIDGVEPFIDWLLENYPENYPYCAKALSDKLKKKYDYLEHSNKYNL